MPPAAPEAGLNLLGEEPVLDDAKLAFWASFDRLIVWTVKERGRVKPNHDMQIERLPFYQSTTLAKELPWKGFEEDMGVSGDECFPSRVCESVVFSGALAQVALRRTGKHPDSAAGVPYHAFKKVTPAWCPSRRRAKGCVDLIDLLHGILAATPLSDQCESELISGGTLFSMYRHLPRMHSYRD